ncbi:MAG: Fe-S cluster assembly protein SufD [Bacteroidia bacterium]
METIVKKDTIKDKLIGEYRSVRGNLFGAAALREEAIAAFEKQGIPNRKSEEYKYVNVEAVLKERSAPSKDPVVSSPQILAGALTVVINGKSVTCSATPPKGLVICSIGEAFEKYSVTINQHYGKYADVDSDPFIALNTALCSEGVFIHVEKNTVIETPVHVIHGSSADPLCSSRNLFVIDDNAQATVIESFESKTKAFRNALTEIVIGTNANVDHYKIQEEGEDAALLSTTQTYQKKQSVFSTHTFTLSGGWVRNNLTMVLDDEHIESHLNGLYLTNGSQVVDNHTLVDHRKPNCNSNELYKGIIEDRSSATFNGKIYVRKDAQKTNAFQSNKNILLSDEGTINTKPQLEIYADDVKCSHGTSTGKLDEDKIFYLRARGLSEASAKKLLMHAFASEVVNTIKVEELRNYVENRISKRFE